MATIVIPQNEKISSASRQIVGFFKLVRQLGPLTVDLDLGGSYSGQQIADGLSRGFAHEAKLCDLKSMEDPETRGNSPETPDARVLLFRHTERPSHDVVIASSETRFELKLDEQYNRLLLIGADMRGEKLAVGVNESEESKLALTETAEKLRAELLRR